MKCDEMTKNIETYLDFNEIGAPAMLVAGRGSPEDDALPSSCEDVRQYPTQVNLRLAEHSRAVHLYLRQIQIINKQTAETNT